ncbi:hypothetical protein L810_5427 [Burkholderia sp. AU4i]|nr:hypothetical protein L810_5427 [Burkholderia sp. AU4i]
MPLASPGIIISNDRATIADQSALNETMQYGLITPDAAIGQG